jgi:hypothetical protein
MIWKKFNFINIFAPQVYFSVSSVSQQKKLSHLFRIGKKFGNHWSTKMNSYSYFIEKNWKIVYFIASQDNLLLSFFKSVHSWNYLFQLGLNMAFYNKNFYEISERTHMPKYKYTKMFFFNITTIIISSRGVFLRVHFECM